MRYVIVSNELGGMEYREWFVRDTMTGKNEARFAVVTYGYEKANQLAQLHCNELNRTTYIVTYEKPGIRVTAPFNTKWRAKQEYDRTKRIYDRVTLDTPVEGGVLRLAAWARGCY